MLVFQLPMWINCLDESPSLLEIGSRIRFKAQVMIPVDSEPACPVKSPFEDKGKRLFV
jgi:hypothetical protein